MRMIFLRFVEIGFAREFLPPSGDLNELLFHSVIGRAYDP